MTAWLLAIGVVVLIGAVAVVATGRGEAMRDVTRERRAARVPASGPLTGGDLRRVRFSTALRGYRADEVDELLARLAAQLDDPDVR
ncbi:DivIVA domain-containing protein [Nocardioides massiliensis]|uniref:DivIVA domain-containing protein n=1 Tax=Nocardioides massiliensis TaxID=1325935 RepID=A0ABT9NJK4_9ACTN|nr:DivIVA domain-containing protein [Nocardioides massiliensis]MDP9820531.1 DivIVA domain-containing protein [Nocardioides massiliensis]